MFTDTDSLVYQIKGKDVYEESFKDRELFDFSEYPVSSKFYDLSNKKVLGKMKDEYKEEKISEFVELKSKIYSLISVMITKLVKQKG